MGSQAFDFKLHWNGSFIVQETCLMDDRKNLVFEVIRVSHSAVNLTKVSFGIEKNAARKQGRAALFPKHFLKLSEAVPSWVFVPCQISFTCSNGKKII
uniref:Uncharacterized protein n=1 Tax=Cucumis melo TaxID=3656 RepID=A0A9I9E4L3_CUCME